MDTVPVRPRWIAGIFLFLAFLAVVTTVRMSWLAFHESWDGMFDPYVANVPGGQIGMMARTLVHGLLMALGMAVTLGTIVRRRWGYLLVRALIPARFLGLLLLILFGNFVGVNLFLRLEYSIATVSVLFAITLLPLSIWSREVKAFYLRPISPDPESGSEVLLGATEENPYRRVSVGEERESD